LTPLFFKFMLGEGPAWLRTQRRRKKDMSFLYMQEFVQTMLTAFHVWPDVSCVAATRVATAFHVENGQCSIPQNE
jgi:hypothetical protein